MIKQFRNFNESCKFVRDLSFGTFKEWKEYCKSGNKPNDVPSTPDKVYKKEWKGWGYWLDGINKPNRFDRYQSYDESIKFVHKLNLTGQAGWLEYCKSGDKPQNIPSSPKDVYKKEWRGFPDWLNSKHNRLLKYLPYNKAIKFVHKLNLTGQAGWLEYCKSGDKPQNIPSSPKDVYKKEWKGVGDWLGTGRIANQDRTYKSFLDAKKFVHTLNLEGVIELKKYCKSGDKPNNVPSTPDRIYKKEWRGFGDWLGTGRIANQTISKKYLPFTESRNIVRKLAKQFNIKNWDDWKKAVKDGKIPQNIPSNPQMIFSKNIKMHHKKM